MADPCTMLLRKAEQALMTVVGDDDMVGDVKGKVWIEVSGLIAMRALC